MYFSLLFTALLVVSINIHSSVLPCLFIHEPHCEVGVRNKHVQRLQLCSLGDGDQCVF